MTIRVCFLWLVIAMACPAAQIVAWKVPVSSFPTFGIGIPESPRLERPPEASAFFSEGDELKDVTPATKPQEGKPPFNVLSGTNPPLEWAVWNATTGMLVTKSDWGGAWQLHELLGIAELPRQCRHLAEVFEVPPDGSPLAGTAKASATLSWISKHGLTAKAEIRGETGWIKIEGSSTLDEATPIITTDLKLNCSLGDLPSLNLQILFGTSSGESVWTARDFDGTRGMDVRITSVVELADGTPFSEAVWIQNGKEKLPLSANYRELIQETTAEGRSLMTLNFEPKAFFTSADPSEGNPVPADPFAETGEEKLDLTALNFPLSQAPPEIQRWIQGPIWDLRKHPWVNFLHLDETDFIGYSLLQQRVFAISRDRNLTGEMISLFGSCYNLPSRVIATFDGQGQTRIVSSSGRLAHLDRKDPSGKIIRVLDLEPTIGDSVLDVRIDFRDGPEDKTLRAVQTRTSANAGRPLEILSGSAGGKDVLPFRLTAEIVTTQP